MNIDKFVATIEKGCRFFSKQCIDIAVSMNKVVIRQVLQGSAVTQTILGGKLYVCLLQVSCSVCLPKIMKIRHHSFEVTANYKAVPFYWDRPTVRYSVLFPTVTADDGKF